MPGNAIGANPALTHTTPRHKLLDTFADAAGREFVYVQSSGAIAQFDFAVVDEDGTARSTTDTISDARDGQRAGIAPQAIAANSYGWLCYNGSGSDIKVNVLASCVANVPLFTTSTSGALDDASANERVSGLVILSTNGGSTAAVLCSLADCRLGMDTAA